MKHTNRNGVVIGTMKQEYKTMDIPDQHCVVWTPARKGMSYSLEQSELCEKTGNYGADAVAGNE